MPPIELGSALPVGAVKSNTVRTAQGGGGRAENAANSPSATVQIGSDMLDPGPAPVDAERVQVIRKAVEDGTYPLVPAKVADAIIAAGLLLRSPK